MNPIAPLINVFPIETLAITVLPLVVVGILVVLVLRSRNKS